MRNWKYKVSEEEKQDRLNHAKDKQEMQAWLSYAELHGQLLWNKMCDAWDCGRDLGFKELFEEHPEKRAQYIEKCMDAREPNYEWLGLPKFEEYYEKWKQEA